MQLFSPFGKYCLLLYKAIRSSTEISTYRENLLREMVKIGFDSIGIITLVGVFTGSVLTLQTAYQIGSYLVPQYVIGSIVSQSMFIELAAAVMSLVLAGRVGARIATELGSMRVSEQVDALEAMGFNSVSFLVVPRVISGILMFPILYIVSCLFGVLGGIFTAYISGSVPVSEFLKGARMFFFPRDVVFGMIKAMVFGYIITSIACFKGYYASGGAEGVGTNTTSATVLGCIFVLLADLVLAAILL